MIATKLSTVSFFALSVADLEAAMVRIRPSNAIPLMVAMRLGKLGFQLSSTKLPADSLSWDAPIRLSRD